MPLEQPRFRPQSAAGGNSIATERFQPRAAPARGPAPVAPTGAIGHQAPTVRNITPLLESLATGNRNLQAAAATYAEGKRNEEKGSAEADATQLSIANRDVGTWAQAVAADPLLADRSPYYRQIFEERLARSTINREANGVFAEYFSSEMAGSSDPSAIQGWLSTRLGNSLDRYNDNPAARAAAAEELRAQSQGLVRLHQGRAATNLVQQNEDSIESRINGMVDGFATRGGAGQSVSFRNGQDPGGLAAGLAGVETEARAQGVSGARLNTIMSKAVAAAAIRHGREDLLELGNRPRADGTPGFGTTLEGRNALEAARQTILNRAVSRQNLAAVQENRARASEGRAISAQVIEMFTRQREAGEQPNISPELLRRIGAAAPDAVPGLLSLQGSMRTTMQQDASRAATTGAANVLIGQQARGEVPTLPGVQLAETARVAPDAVSGILALQSSIRNGQEQTEDPRVVGGLLVQAMRGELSPTDILAAHGPNGWTNPATMSRLAAVAKEAQENASVLNSPVFTTFQRNTMAAALGVEASGVIRNDPAVANIERYIFEQTASFWQANPSARGDLVATMRHLQERRDDIVRAFNPTANLSGNRVEARIDRANNPPPAVPTLGGFPILAPSATADWRTRPAFTSTVELEAAWQGYNAFVQNPGQGTPDPANPINRWIAAGIPLSTFIATQRRLIQRLEPRGAR